MPEKISGLSPLDAFIRDLCRDIEQAMGCADCVEVELASIEVVTDMAIQLSLVLNELLTNALKYGSSPYRVGLQARDGSLVMTVTDAGEGPTDQERKGLGSQIVAAAAKQLAATIETIRSPEGYRVELRIPLRPAVKDESVDSRG